MSIFGTIAKVFSEPIESAISLGEKVWYGIKSIWYVLDHGGELLNDAWTWMLHGGEWLGNTAGEYAGAAGDAIEHVILTTIPKAVEWVAVETAKHIAGELVAAYNELRYIITLGTHYALSLISQLAKEVEAEVKAVVKWVNGAVSWVDRLGTHVWFLLSHPENLARWVISSLVGPLTITLLRASVPVFGWLFQSWAGHSSDIAHIIEDVLSKIA